MTLAFLAPKLLWLLILALIPFVPRRRASTPLSSLAPLRRLKPGWRIRLHRLQPWSAALGLALLVLILAGPVARTSTRHAVREGVDLMLVLDTSASQNAVDIAPSRMIAAREAAAAFLDERRNDRIGVILFSGVPILLSPPVIDKAPLIARLKSIEADRSGSGTAIGDALAAAVARLKESPAQSKAIVLLTDGSSNRGRITPRAASRAAAALGVRVYTIGYGSLEGAEIPLGPDGAPARNADGSPIRGVLEEDPLIEMARITGGQYFRAASGDALRTIYKTIDSLEKSPLETREVVSDEPLTPLLRRILLILLGLDLLMFRVWLRVRPTGYLTDIVALATVALLLIPAPAGPATATASSAPALALAIDVSASMAADDVEPSRLGRALREARTLVTGLPNARFSLTLIGGEGVVQAPLTEDREAILFFIDRLSTGVVAAPGSAPEEGILAALQTLSSVSGERAVVLFSDAERTVTAPPPRLPQNVPVYVVPLGTAEGAKLYDSSGLVRTEKNGEAVISRIDQERSERMAKGSGGRILAVAPGAPAILPLIELWRPPEALAAPTRWWLWAALGLIVLRTFPWYRRKSGWSAWVPAFTALALTISACSGQRSEDAFSEGTRLAKIEDFAGAAAAFARAAGLSTGSERGIALYNQGSAALLAGEAESALVPLEQALLLLPGDSAVRTNLALALRAAGNAPQNGRGEKDEGESNGSGDSAMSREQALQLIEAVRPQAFAESAADLQVREERVERDW